MSDWDDDDGYDDEYGDGYGDGYGDDGIAETRPCPECGAEVYEEASMCPECGELIDWRHRRSPFDGRPDWYIMLALAGILGTCLVLAL